MNKICINGLCTNSSLATQDTCPFGDDIVTQDIASGLGITLPSYQSTCQQTFTSLQLKNLTITSFCNSTYYSQFCCQSCKSEI